jgi:benzoyl-CoA reductase/2-hydroxyglutaryl-CoA dehydratase subunit BcrC/BadD/HgdB
MNRPCKTLGQILYESAPIGYLNWKIWSQLDPKERWVHERVAQTVARAALRRAKEKKK